MIVSYYDAEFGTNVTLLRGTALRDDFLISMGGKCSFAFDEVISIRGYLGIDDDRVSRKAWLTSERVILWCTRMEAHRSQ